MIRAHIQINKYIKKTWSRFASACAARAFGASSDRDSALRENWWTLSARIILVRVNFVQIKKGFFASKVPEICKNTFLQYMRVNCALFLSSGFHGKQEIPRWECLWCFRLRVMKAGRQISFKILSYKGWGVVIFTWSLRTCSQTGKYRRRSAAWTKLEERKSLKKGSCTKEMMQCKQQEVGEISLLRLTGQMNHTIYQRFLNLGRVLWTTTYLEEYLGLTLLISFFLFF